MTGLNKSIVTIGECMVELAPREDGAYARGFAGDTFNTAWYLRRQLPADWAVDYFTAVGEDGLSDRMVGFIGEAGVGTDFIRRVGRRTVGLYMIELANGERSFIYWRDSSAAKLLAEDRDALQRAVAGRDLVLISGITLAILSVEHRRALLDVLATARAGGATIVLDPNMRLRLWPDRDTMAAAIMEAAGVADVLLPSFDEDQSVFGDDTPAATIERYRARGVKTVVVKNGGGVMQAWDQAGGDVRHAPEPAASVVDTTAAGDSFNAGFLAARLTGEDLLAAMKKGAALAGKVIQKRGALVDTGD